MKFIFLLSCILIVAHGTYLPSLKAQNGQPSYTDAELTYDKCETVVQTIQDIGTLTQAHPLPPAFIHEFEAALDIYVNKIKSLAKANGINFVNNRIDESSMKKVISQKSDDESEKFRLKFCRIFVALVDQTHELHIDYGVYAQGLMARRQTLFSSAYQRRYYRIMEKYNGNAGNNADSFFDPLKDLEQRREKRRRETENSPAYKFLMKSLEEARKPLTYVNPAPLLQAPKIEPFEVPLPGQIQQNQNYFDFGTAPLVEPIGPNGKLVTSDPCYNKWRQTNTWGVYYCQDTKSGALWYYTLGGYQVQAGNDIARKIEASRLKRPLNTGY